MLSMEAQLVTTIFVDTRLSRVFCFPKSRIDENGCKDVKFKKFFPTQW